MKITIGHLYPDLLNLYGEVEGHCILNAVNVIYERMKRMEPDMVIRTLECNPASFLDI